MISVAYGRDGLIWPYFGEFLGNKRWWKCTVNHGQNRLPPPCLFRPMTFGNIRSLGVRPLAVTCDLCHHEAVMAADEWSDAVLVRTSGLGWSAPVAG